MHSSLSIPKAGGDKNVCRLLSSIRDGLKVVVIVSNYSTETTTEVLQVKSLESLIVVLL